jgi:hypothetical protein
LFDGAQVVLTADKRYDARLQEFIAEIEQLNLPALAATRHCCLREDIENGVDIGYDVTSLSDRKILHHVGRMYGLIALCPGDVVDVENVQWFHEFPRHDAIRQVANKTAASSLGSAVPDLHGRMLYHVTTRVDTAKGTLTNTGAQVFSGTVAGSKPVMIHDSKFRFEVNLNTGAESGSVFLVDHIAGPRVRRELSVTGSGKTAEGNPTFKYAGTCKFT